MSRHLSDFEERRLDQLAFAADEAEDDYRLRGPRLTPVLREQLREKMHNAQHDLEAFIQGKVLRQGGDDAKGT